MWESIVDPDFADIIRERGVRANRDPLAEGTSADNYHNAIVLGLPAAGAKGMLVRLALTVDDETLPSADRVPSLQLPRGMGRATNGRQVNLMPEPTSVANVHPYRLPLHPYHLKVAFLTSPGPNPDLKGWTLVAPHVINPYVELSDKTYANAHVL
jgi:hypothetical protein